MSSPPTTVAAPADLAVTPDAAAHRRAAAPGRAGRELRAFAELLALTGLTVAQPVLDSFENSPESLVYRRASTLDIVLLGVLVTFGIPLALWALEAVIGLLSRRVRRWAHVAMLAALFGLGAWEVTTRSTELVAPARAAVAVLFAAGATLVVTKVRPARTFLQFLALSPIIVLTLWLATGQVHHVAFAEGPDTAQGLPIADPAPIVMIVMDEFPTASLLDDTGHVDETLYPNFARLAADSSWYRNTSSVSPTTPEAVPAILTGRFPSALDRPPTTDSYPENLFSAVRGTYDLNVWELVTQLCPPEECPEQGGAIDQGLVPLLADSAEVWSEYLEPPTASDDEAYAVRQSDPDAPHRLEEFAASIQESDDPRLDFIHVTLPHQPWRHLPSGARHDAPFLAEGLGAPNYSWKTPYFAEAGRQRHLLQLQRADEAIGTVLRRLDDLDRYDESLIVVTADHGVAFRAGSPIRGLSEATTGQIMWVPFFVKSPGQSDGRIDDRPIQTVDVLPTIAEEIGLDLPWDVDGRPASEPRTPEDETRRFYPWKYNTVIPEGTLDYATIDGVEGFENMLDVEPPGSDPRDDLQLYRFGRWGDLVGEEVTSLDVGEASGLTTTVTDEDFKPETRDHFDVTLGQAVVPVYVRGEIDSSRPTDLAVAVNGFVAGWGEVFFDEGEQRWFVLTPQELFAEGSNEIEVFTLSGEPEDPTLRPVDVDWRP